MSAPRIIIITMMMLSLFIISIFFSSFLQHVPARPPARMRTGILKSARPIRYYIAADGRVCTKLRDNLGD